MQLYIEKVVIYYDFNKGNRSFKAELVTRVGAHIESAYGAKPFKIYY